MFLINLSSNVNAKFYIGSALTRLNELGDMYVSSIYKTPDRKGGDHDYANCCIELNAKMSFDKLREATKALEKELGRGSVTVSVKQVVIDIDILATHDENGWQFIEKRLPLSDGECWALDEMAEEIKLDLPNTPKQPNPVLADWQLQFWSA